MAICCKASVEYINTPWGGQSFNVTTVGTHGVLQTAKLQKKRGQETYL